MSYKSSQQEGKNKYNLSRYIKKEIKRQVRLNSKFGCVICRNAICHYEHIDPEFKDAKEHDPEKICLLCGGCHDKVTRGRISKNTVKRKYKEVQYNDNIKPPFDEFDLNSLNPIIKLGGGTFEFCNNLIVFGSEILLKIDKPEEGNSFPTISGCFYDSDGKKLLEISENIWECSTFHWDVTTEANRLTIFSSKNNII